VGSQPTTGNSLIKFLSRRLDSLEPNLIIAEEQSFPSIVLVCNRCPYLPICFQLLIAHNYTVTAAHCLDGRSLDSILVRVGSNSLRNDPLAKEVEIGKTIVHPSYDAGTIRNDIGVIKVIIPSQHDLTQLQSVIGTCCEFPHLFHSSNGNWSSSST